MYRGRFEQGQFANLGVLCLDANSTPTAPAVAPTMDVWNGSTLVLAAKQIPPVDRSNAKGLFGFNLFLDGRFPPGSYQAVYRYKLGSFNGLEVDYFEITAGGNQDGTIIGLHWIERPEATYLAWQTDGGKLQFGRNPTI